MLAIDEFAIVFLRTESVWKIELFGIDNAVWQRNTLRSQIAVDARISRVIPRLPLAVVDKRLAAFVMPFEQMIQFVENHASSLFNAELL